MELIIYFIIGLIFLKVATYLWAKDNVKIRIDEIFIFVFMWPFVIIICSWFAIEKWLSNKSK